MSSETAAEPTTQSVPETVKAVEPTTAAVETKTAELQPEKKVELATDKPTEAVTAPAEAPAEQTAAAAPVAEQKNETTEKRQEPEVPAQPEYLTKVPGLSKFFDSLPGILEKTGHSEMWGVPLKDSKDIPTVNVLIKFLRANEGNIKQAEEQLTKALQWRKEINPVELAKNAKFSAKKFEGLGYITSYLDPTYGETIFTWNIYGGAKDLPNTFGDLDEFIRWRTALMERGVQELKLNEATEVIEYDGEDRYQMLQVHDYKGVSFLRLDPAVKAASKKTIEVFSTAYPELLREKFFVNVPAIMGWMFGAMKIFLSKNTIRKFHPISNGANLGREFAFVEDLPKSYGGQGAELKDAGRSVPLIDDIPAGEPAKAATEAAKETATEKKVESGAVPAPAPTATEVPKEEALQEEPPREEAPKAEPSKPEEPSAAEPAAEESK
ncbi:CRAL/TRIO domain protein [Talaromyces stipitatus ATCC 10500]|uniref:Phosphatidylinositol transfer protein SFH5 n=1 Tax=Talaromyces stipitatus (strain ATCC 10500 / CBS 375.48 / QM 6759 / NRRL 1006) TaxID=441959 RepID=B8M9I3_TALSN|nr:CRAL/TRIO domain protein [Talaromyces stipitatus ATCC 10500]XP_002481978.1 CRAL/TRIO domain protein [Talaromyces stipitatus ATCC 10500]EED17985.1 CRAL/TRIO domain protein [Talaromyces stipitatus ATCC 10500]EED17986.1 CRAL/TRIO domain protein [Talaromyces stipitatus ATCC 10500]